MEQFWHWSKGRIASLVVALLNVILAYSMNLPFPFDYYLGKTWLVVLVLEIVAALPLIWVGYFLLGWILLLFPAFCWLSVHLMKK